MRSERPAVRWLPIFVVVLSVLLCLPRASATRNPLGDELHAKGVEPGLQAPLQVVLGGRRNVHERLHAIQQSIRTSYQALPKNANGNLALGSVRHLMRYYFAKEHGWLIRGIEPHGMRASCKALHEVAILRERTPILARALLDTRVSERGLSLGDVVALVAALEQLVFDESVMLLDAAYKLANHSTVVDLTENELHFILRVYLLFMKEGGAYPASGDINDGSERWRSIVDFESDTVLNTLHSLEERTNPFRPRTFSFLQAAEFVELLFYRYGRWQNNECEKMKDDLLSLENPLGSGRVPISSFYGKPLSHMVSLNFSESVEYLRNLGSIDDSSQNGPKLLISNYVNGPSNYLGKPFRYFSVCCFNECDGIISVIEGKVQRPYAPPDRLLEIAANLTSRSVEHARTLPSALVAKMHFIAERNNGEVPLHGRLFAQWLHFLFPNECPYPQAMDGSVRATQDLFVINASRDERQKHMTAPPLELEPETKREKWEAFLSQFLSQWSDEEELPLHEESWSPGGSSLTTTRSTAWIQVAEQVFRTCFFALCVLFVGVKMAWQWLETLSPKEEEGGLSERNVQQSTGMGAIVEVAVAAAEGLEGTWCYGSGSKYILSLVDPQHYSFEETLKSGVKITGLLSQHGEWYEGQLSSDSKPHGSVRIRLAYGGLISNFRSPNDVCWQMDVVALAKDNLDASALPTDAAPAAAPIAAPTVAAAAQGLMCKAESDIGETEFPPVPEPKSSATLTAAEGFMETQAAPTPEEPQEADAAAVGDALPEPSPVSLPAEPIQVVVAEEPSSVQEVALVRQLEEEKPTPLDQAQPREDSLHKCPEDLREKPAQRGEASAGRVEKEDLQDEPAQSREAIAGRVGKEVKRLEAENAMRNISRTSRKNDRGHEKASQLAPMQFSERWKRFHSLSQALVETPEKLVLTNKPPAETGKPEVLPAVQLLEDSSTLEVQGDAQPATPERECDVSPEQPLPEIVLQAPEEAAEATVEALDALPEAPCTDSPAASADAPREDAAATPALSPPVKDAIDTLPNPLLEVAPGSPTSSLLGGTSVASMENSPGATSSVLQEEVVSPGTLPADPPEASPPSPKAPPAIPPAMASPKEVSQEESLEELQPSQDVSQTTMEQLPEQVPSNPQEEAVPEEVVPQEDDASLQDGADLQIESNAASEAVEEAEAEAPTDLEFAGDSALLESACDADCIAESSFEPTNELVGEPPADQADAGDGGGADDDVGDPDVRDAQAASVADEAEAQAEPEAQPTLEQLSEPTVELKPDSAEAECAEAALETEVAEADAPKAEAAEAEALEAEAAEAETLEAEAVDSEAPEAEAAETAAPEAEAAEAEALEADAAALQDASDVLKEILGNLDPCLPSDCSGTTEWGMDASCTDKTGGTVVDELDTQGGSDISQPGSSEQHVQLKDLEDDPGAAKKASLASSGVEEDSCFTELSDNSGDVFSNMLLVNNSRDFFADDTKDDAFPMDERSSLLQSMDAEANKVEEPLRKAPLARQPFRPAEPPPPAPRLPPRPPVFARINGVKAPPPVEPPVVVAKRKGPRPQVIIAACPPHLAVRQGKLVAKAAQQTKAPPSCSPSQAETSILQKAKAKGPPVGLKTPASLPPVVVKPATGVKHAEGKAPPPLGTNAKDTLRSADTLRSSGKAPPEFKAPPPPFPAGTTVRSAKSDKVTSYTSSISSHPSLTSSPPPALTELAAPPMTSQANLTEAAMPMPRFLNLKVQKRNKMLKSSLPQVPESNQRVSGMPGEEPSEDEDLESTQLRQDWAADAGCVEEHEKCIDKQEKRDEQQASPVPVAHPPEPSAEAIASILHCPEGAEAAPEATMELKAFLGLGLGNEGEETKASTVSNSDPPITPDRGQQAKGQRMFKGFSAADNFSLFTGLDPARSYFHAPGDNQGVPYGAMFAANPRAFFGMGANMRAGAQYQRTPGESEPEEEPPGQTFVMPEGVAEEAAQPNMARSPQKRKGPRRKRGDVRSWSEMEALVSSRMRFARPPRGDGSGGAEWASGMWPGAWSGHGDGNLAWMAGQPQAAGWQKLWGEQQADNNSEWYDMSVGKPGDAYMQHPSWRTAAEAHPRWNRPQPSSEAGAHFTMPEPRR